ncbi:hypothetical protein ALQ13_02130 [Pseudomonas savastanoi pv. glycinea]|nr:hypothetical protein ALQ13_02130 [Pseudomonas savastanoi pv. glycinea]RMP99266.1 hypothetical protein ALQ12_00541 [Pseudomonas savastanoi pv. glycinea]
MNAVVRWQPTQALGKLDSLQWVFAEQQRAFQVETFGLRAFKELIQAGTGQVISAGCLTQLDDAVGVFERSEKIIVDLMQMPQVTR